MSFSASQAVLRATRVTTVGVSGLGQPHPAFARSVRSLTSSNDDASASSPASEPSSSASTSSPSRPPPIKRKWTIEQKRHRQRLLDQGQLGLPLSTTPPPPPRPLPSAGQAHRNAARAAGEGRPPSKTRADAAQRLEEREYLEEQRTHEADRALENALGDTKRKRDLQRWAWEWFSEGKELSDIGLVLASLENPPRKVPPAPTQIADLILTHLSHPPPARTAPPPNQDDDHSHHPFVPAPHTRNSYHLLTEDLWARLTENHEIWAGLTLAETINARLEHQYKENASLFDLLRARGWRGELGDGVSEDTFSPDREELDWRAVRNFIARETDGQEVEIESETMRIARVLAAVEKKRRLHLMGEEEEEEELAEFKGKRKEKGRRKAVPFGFRVPSHGWDGGGKRR